MSFKNQKPNFTLEDMCCNGPMPTSITLLNAYYDINVSKYFSIVHIEKK